MIGAASRRGLERDGHRHAGHAAARLVVMLMQKWFVKGLVDTEK
jgi:hypothetical protein